MITLTDNINVNKLFIRIAEGCFDWSFAPVSKLRIEEVTDWVCRILIFKDLLCHIFIFQYWRVKFLTFKVWRAKVMKFNIWHARIFKF